MRTLRYILTLVLTTKILLLNGQDKCVCCTNYSIKNETFYEYFFDPDIIKAENIKKATVYTTETNSQKTFEFINTKFLFDSTGYITARYEYNQNGKPHMLKEYTRDKSGKLIRTEYAYLNNDELKNNSTKPIIHDFSYNTKGQLVKVKKRDYMGLIIADSLSNYTTYEYDTTGRIIKEYRYSNYSGKIYAYEQNINYQSDEESIGITQYNGKVWVKTSSQFDNKFRLIKQTHFDIRNNKIANYIEYVFLNDLLTKQENRCNGFTECPDNGNFTEDYTYNNFGLLEKINHEFNDETCLMSIKYE